MELKKVIQYRDVWMGLAIAWVVFFHSGIWPAGELMTDFKMIGFGGVDIFIFASGIGCFWSLKKDDDYLGFIKRRAMRIIPTYWMFLVGWSIYKVIYSGMSWNAVLGNFLCVRSLTGLNDDFNWYMSGIWIMYFMAPFLKGFVDKIDTMYKFLAGVGMVFLFTICFWDVSTLIIIMSRMPIFLIGMYVGKLAMEDNSISKWGIVGAIVLSIVGFGMLSYFQKAYPDYLWSRAYYWYPFILIVPGVCIAISLLMECLKKILGKIGEFTISIFEIPGKFSFEIYLLHIWFFDILSKNLIVNEIVEDKRSVWVLTIIALVPACWVLRYISKKAVSIIGKNKCHRYVNLK